MRSALRTVMPALRAALPALHAVLPALGLAAVLGAQEAPRVELSGPSPAVVRLGGSAALEIEVRGTSVGPSAPELPVVDGLRTSVGAPQRMHRESIIGGRREVVESVSWAVELRPERAGEFTIPAFDVDTGRGTRQVGPVRLQCVVDTRGADFGFLELEVAPQRVYVNEPFDVRLEYGVDERLRLATRNVRTRRGVASVLDIGLQADWLDELDGTVRQEVERDDVPDHVEGTFVNDGAYGLPAERGHRRGEQRYLRFVLDRRYLPTRAGTLELGQPVLRFTASKGRQRIGLFGERLQGETENLYVYGEPRSVEVRPLPEAGRPADFTGAVGRFELSAEVDRTRLRVGESLKWTLRVRGQGNLEFLGLPELEDVEGFHVLGRNENRTAAAAELTLDLRPLDAAVDELPAVSWSFFDTTPGVERYRRVRSAPIALQVEPLPDGAPLDAPDTSAEGALVPGVDDIHDILGPGELAAPPPGTARDGWWRYAAVLAPWLVVLLGAGLVRRWRARLRDSVTRRARRAQRELHEALDGGAGADQALAGYLAARLGVAAAAIASDPDRAARLCAAGCDAELARRAHELIERGAAARYGGGAPPADADVRALVAELERQPLRRAGARSGAAGLLLPLLLLPGAAASAELQDAAPSDPAAAARRAYRDGDAARAAALWRTALEAADADPRLYYNLGNALYRDGRKAAALWAWERARPALPRDPRLAANVALVERQLGVGRGGREISFFGALRELSAALTAAELWWLCALLNLLAALLWLGARGGAPRLVAALVTVPALLVALEVVWLGPARPPQAIVLGDGRAAVRAEPSPRLEPVAELKPGARVAVLGRGPEWSRVRLPKRAGYVRSARLGFL